MHRSMLGNLIKVGGAIGIASVGLFLFSSILTFQPALAEENIPQAVSQSSNSIDILPAGEINLAGAEIVAFDSGSQQFYVTSGDGLQIIDGSDPASMSLVTTIDPSTLGFDNKEFTSVSVANGVVAASLPAMTETDPGFVLFFDVTGTLQSSVTVGSLPDMVTFTPDGTQVLAAIEGQPNEDDPVNIDPEGGIAVIDLSGGVASPVVTDLSFNIFTTDTIEPAVRIFPNKTVAQDVEPEYITVNPAGTVAYATLQEANSVAVIDMTVPTITQILPLGTKDHSVAGNGLDASNRDDAINIQNWPVQGLYMPDAIASYEVSGQLYLVTANEGDARDAYGDDPRVADLVLDPDVFTDAMSLQMDENLGRLKVSSIDGINETKVGFIAEIDGDQSGTDSEAEGIARFVLNAAEDTLSYTMQVEGLDFGTWATGMTTTASISDDVTSMHIHVGASGATGGIALGMISPAQDDSFTVTVDSDGVATITGAWDATDASTIALSEFVSNTAPIAVDSEVAYYINIHTTANPSGEIRGQMVKANVYDELYSFGARSFTIWNATSGAVVYDSGDFFEQHLAEVNPIFFNANDGTPEEFDARSDDKGPEPEGVTVGTVNSTTYAFVGNERADGRIMVYDVTNPVSPTFVTSFAKTNSVAPEGILFIDGSDSPTGNPLLAITYEETSDLVVYEITEGSGNFKLQVLHASDLEGGKEAIDDAKRFAAIVEGLELEASNSGYGSIVLSAGDNYIPGPFFGASDSFDMRSAFVDVYGSYFGIPSDINNFREAAGRADITIMNIVGFDASVMGNHEFDAGTNAIETIIAPDVRDTNVRWAGSQFPYLAANLDFSMDGDLSGLYTSSIISNTDSAVLPLSTDLFTATANAPKIAPATYVNVDGEIVGVVGATTPILASISSPGDTKVISGGSNDMTILASIINPVIAEMSTTTDKVILVSHLQQIALEKELAGLLNGVDIIIAGGSDTLQANMDDTLRPGDTADEAYPAFATNADGNPVAIVSTDGQYSYVGRLVVEFDAMGNILTDTIGTESGPVATVDAEISALWGMTTTAYAEGTKAEAVEDLTDVLSGIVTAKDGIVYGQTSVYLEGRRSFVRTQETNLGTMSAQANLEEARMVTQTMTSTLRSGLQMTSTTMMTDVMVSIKNGGGIRAAIGEISQTDSTTDLLPPQANPASGKLDGQVSQLDLENTFKFNNSLTIMDLSAAELKQVMEHGVAASGDGATPGQFPQVAGMRFSFDPSEQAQVFSGTTVITEGQRIRSLAIVDENGVTKDIVVQNGQIVGDPERQIKIVTLNFLAEDRGNGFGGDNYPFPIFGENVVSTEIGEQTAMANYFTNNFPVSGSATFDVAETPASEDSTIQDLSVKAFDSVLRILWTPFSFNQP